MATRSEKFYRDLPVHSDFTEMLDSHNYVTAPDDWSIVVVDLKGSTDAIAKGRYKDVNILGATAIIAVLNAVGDHEIPYVFGGDGATFLIPNSRREDVAAALFGTQKMSREAFGMELRAGMIALKDLPENVSVAKFRVSKDAILGMLAGNGVAQAEDMVKNSHCEKTSITSIFGASVLEKKKPDFTGLECRWDAIKSAKGYILTLMAVARGATAEGNTQIYADIHRRIGEIYGEVRSYHPVSPQKMEVAFASAKLGRQAKVRTYMTQIPLSELFYLLGMQIVALFGMAVYGLGLKAGKFDAKANKEEIIANTDFRKFDGMLRMVIDSDAAQKEKLEKFLDDLHRQEKIFYGLQVSDSALMTCFVRDMKERHLHFVDGANGGYAMAARQMKAQMKAAAAG